MNICQTVYGLVKKEKHLDEVTNAFDDASRLAGISVRPKNTIISNYLPKGVIAAVGKLYDGAETLIVNAKEFYPLPYKEKIAVMTHEALHLYDMAGGKLSNVLKHAGERLNSCQENILDYKTHGVDDEGVVNYIASVLNKDSKVLQTAYKTLTDYTETVMDTAGNMCDQMTNMYRPKKCSGC
ncbi:MAG: hypothetical protein KAI53_04370 [Candidatus Aenigmarchaeota archaeon]|nr:hypothetical protein [Candidatus Aenigmarchaeota archaeon]